MDTIRGASTIYISQSIDQTLTPPKTPPAPGFSRGNKFFHNWPEPETFPEDTYLDLTYGYFENNEFAKDAHSMDGDEEFDVSHQNVLLLHGSKQRYAYTTQQSIPQPRDDREMLVAVEVVGLNPIDWKAPDFGFGLPPLPCISGRDLAGKVIKAPRAHSRFVAGDTVIGISTDYRDSRKSAFQQYAVVSDYNACKVPGHLSTLNAASVGVAFVAAALALGICMGMDFVADHGLTHGPDLLHDVHALPRDALPEDIRKECFDGITIGERIKSGDWIAIWGGSSATGCCAVQLAKMAGLRVISIIDVARSGERMLRYGADLLVDRMDTERAVSIVKGVTKGKLRFALDTQGRESAKLLARTLQGETTQSKHRAHLVGLVGLPKEPSAGVLYHTVPIKAFHEAPVVGGGMTRWLEDLLDKGLLATPEIEVGEGGLEGINTALDRLRSGTVRGPRIVVPLTSTT